VFSVSSPSIIDTEATEDKKYGYDDEKKYGYEDEKKYGYDDEKKYGNDDEKKYGYGDEDKKYAYAEEEKYGHDGGDKKYGYEEEKKYGHDKEKDYGYEEEKKYGYDGGDKKYGYEQDAKYGYEEEKKYGDKSSVKYIKCANININGGKSFQTGGDRPNHFGNYGGMMSGGNSYGDGMTRGSDYGDNSYGKFPGGYIKETHKDVKVICIQNNNGNATDNEPQSCEDCFKVRSEGGAIPNGLEDELLAGIIEEFPGVTNFAQLCVLLEQLRIAGDSPTVEAAEAFLNDVWQGQANPSAIERLIDCLLTFDLLDDTTP
jgi:hypothetical protein